MVFYSYLLFIVFFKKPSIKTNMDTKAFLAFLDQYKLLISAILLLFLTIVMVQLNYNKNHMKNYTVDEYYTITSVHPKYDATNTRHRALNGPRLFTYLFYPGALVGMIGHMGGNIYVEGWDYPGHKYIIENYKLNTSQAAENLEDPNLRYFHYYLKLQSIILLFLTMIPLIFYLWKRQYFIAMFMVATLVGVNFLALEERSLFYIEPLLLSMINLLLWLYLYIFDKGKVNIFWIVLTAIVIAVSISLKFSSLIFIALLLGLIVFKSKSLEERIRNLSLLMVFSLIFFCLINWNMFYSKEVFNNMVHDYFSNFYQYATGARKEVLQNYRLENFKGIMGELFTSFGGLLFVLPLVFGYGFIKLKKKERKKWGPLLLSLLISVGLIISQRVYVDRNILPFLAAIVLVSGVMLDEVFKHLNFRGSPSDENKKLTTYLVLIAIVILPMLIFVDGYFKTLFPGSKSNIVNTITNIQDKENRRLLSIDYNAGSTRSLFEASENLPSFPETYGDLLKAEAVKFSKDFNTTDLVVVKEIKNNKQLTNYILPKLYNSNEQFGSFFLYYNDINQAKAFKKLENEIRQKGSSNLLSKPLNIREDLVVDEIRISKLSKGYRLFLKLQEGDLLFGNLEGCRFYIHTTPFDEDIDNLPEDRKIHGFEGWGFTVSDKNIVRFGKTSYVYGDFNPALSSYKSLSFGIFKGCAKSEDVIVEDVQLQ